MNTKQATESDLPVRMYVGTLAVYSFVAVTSSILVEDQTMRHMAFYFLLAFTVGHMLTGPGVVSLLWKSTSKPIVIGLGLVTACLPFLVYIMTGYALVYDFIEIFYIGLAVLTLTAVGFVLYLVVRESLIVNIQDAVLTFVVTLTILAVAYLVVTFPASTDWLSWFAIGGAVLAVLSILINSWALEWVGPILEIGFCDLPPYDSPENETSIRIHNLGRKSASLDVLEIQTSYSIDTVFTSTIDTQIYPGEVLTVKAKILDPPEGTHMIKFIVETHTGVLRKRQVCYLSEVRIHVE